MKPFDLEKALAGEPVVTKLGHRVDRIEIFKEIDRLVALIDGQLIQYKINGEPIGLSSQMKLFMSQREKRYFCVFRALDSNGRPYYGTSPLHKEIVGLDDFLYFNNAKAISNHELEIEV